MLLCSIKCLKNKIITQEPIIKNVSSICIMVLSKKVHQTMNQKSNIQHNFLPEVNNDEKGRIVFC